MIVWVDIEVLLVVVGVEVIEGFGFCVRFCKGDVVEMFYWLYFEKEVKCYQVKVVCDFLRWIGVML